MARYRLSSSAMCSTGPLALTGAACARCLLLGRVQLPCPRQLVMPYCNVADRVSSKAGTLTLLTGALLAH